MVTPKSFGLTPNTLVNNNNIEYCQWKVRLSTEVNLRQHETSQSYKSILKIEDFFLTKLSK